MRVPLRTSTNFLSAALFVFGQSDNFTISGDVKDPSGAAVIKPTMTLKNENTAFERVSATNDPGFYSVTNIAPGYYTVSFVPNRID